MGKMELQRGLFLWVLILSVTSFIYGPTIIYANVIDPGACASIVNGLLSGPLCNGILARPAICCPAISSACAPGVLTSLPPSTFSPNALQILRNNCNIIVTGIPPPPPPPFVVSSCSNFLSTWLSSITCTTNVGAINPTSICCRTIVGTSICGVNGVLVQSISLTSFTSTQIQILTQCGILASPPSAVTPTPPPPLNSTSNSTT